MTILAIVLILLAEAALVTLTFAKQRETAQWLRNRAVSRAVEFVLLLGVVLLPATFLKWRFTGALITLGVLLLIAALIWLIKRKKASGSVKAGKVIGSVLLTVFMLGFALVPAVVFRNYNGLKTSGAYEVRSCSAILVDESRTDTFETDGSFREVPAHFYYPDAEGSFPLIVFSHGAFGYYQSNYSTYAELASNGYVVAALDHPHHAFFSKDTDGRLIPVDAQFIGDAIDIENGVKSEADVYAVTREWMQLRTDDMNFVIDTIKTAKADGALGSAWHTETADEALSVLARTDTDHIGLIGHSMGGATAEALGRTRSDVGAVIILDGTMLSDLTGFENGVYTYNEAPYPVPVLDFGKKSDYDGSEQQYENVNDFVIRNARDGRKVLFDGVAHMDFTDLPLFSPFLASMLGSEKIDHAAFMNKVNGLVLNWFDYYLKGKGTLNIPAAD